jgi:hypothetical protein
MFSVSGFFILHENAAKASLVSYKTILSLLVIKTIVSYKTIASYKNYRDGLMNLENITARLLWWYQL